MKTRAVLIVAAMLLGAACSNSGSPTTPSGSPTGACKTNADCSPGHVCYFHLGMACGGSGGVCVARLATPCSQNAGGACPCLDVPQGECSGGSVGSACRGGDQPAQCWYCYVPS